MGLGEKVDYRISMLVVLCKDCNQDVGLYPARHQCQVERPPLPPLPPITITSEKSDPPITTSLLRKTSSPALLRKQSAREPTTLKDTNTITRANSTITTWSSRFGRQRSTKSNNNKENSPLSETSLNDDQKEEDTTSYLDHYYAQLPETDEQQPKTTGLKKKWGGSVRQNEKWKQLVDKSEKEKQSSPKLWKKLVQATQNMASQDDQGPESDESDWEGESHVSRILREYYEKKQVKLPPWLLDDRTPLAKTTVLDEEPLLQRQRSSSSRGRLWEQSTTKEEPSARELERQAFRQEHRQVLMNNNDNDHSDMDDDRRRYKDLPSTDDEHQSIHRKSKRLERMKSARRFVEEQYEEYDDNDQHGPNPSSSIRRQHTVGQNRMDQVLLVQQARHAAISRSRSDRAIRNIYQDRKQMESTAIEITPSNYRSFMSSSNENKSLVDSLSSKQQRPKQRYLSQRQGLDYF
ncbi:uncharacterized protein BX664DRAFT_301792 [Halteromyces radiatus]|uniref:uncharacterized protein n=1 Tax=Halteromyces radiatus TaxID=101107 RepID=UPI0022211B9E|nr:uncharacterized protein BX664DRAFT_301792 [Halteromyces radiatus]KAI8083142.1 hypothetical protein BX664DRAFT_301792 [Halteromyces radiatus]